MNDSQQAPASPDSSDRRGVPERRQRHWYGLWAGHGLRRRQGPRRHKDRYLAVVDWHHPHWLLVGMLILVLCTVDALFTIQLIARGATEINPFMAPLVEGAGEGFAYWKMGLTAVGVIILTALARLRLFGPVRVGALLYAVLGLYTMLVCYELWLLIGAGFH